MEHEAGRHAATDPPLDQAQNDQAQNDQTQRDDRHRRRRAGLWSIALTLAIGLVIAGSLVVVQLRHNRDVDAADRAARLAAIELGVIRARTVREIAAAGVGRPDELKVVAQKQAEQVPPVPDVSSYGAEHSVDYRSVEQDRSDLASSLRQLAKVAGSSAPVVELLDAADAALAVRPTTLAPVGLQTDGSALRATVVAGMQDVLVRFRAVTVPKGHEQVAQAVEAALQHVIDEASALANRLDSGSGGSFAYAREYTAARQAVEDERTRVTGDLQEAMNAVVGSGNVPDAPAPSTPQESPDTDSQAV